MGDLKRGLWKVNKRCTERWNLGRGTLLYEKIEILNSLIWAKRAYMLYVQGRYFQAILYGIASVSYKPINRMAWGIVTKSILPASLVRRLRSQ